MDLLETFTDELMARYRLAAGVQPGLPLAFEMLLGSRTPQVIVIGENPGGSEVPHHSGAACLGYGTQFFRTNGHYEQWASVWRRYAWMLPSNPLSDPTQFGQEASEHLMVTNCWHLFGNPLPKALRSLKGVGVAGLIESDSIKNVTIVTQGAPAWAWIRKVSTPLTLTNPTRFGLEALWGKPGYRQYTGPRKYKAAWKGNPDWPVYVMPVAHLSGRYNFQHIPTALELQAQYREEWRRPPS